MTDLLTELTQQSLHRMVVSLPREGLTLAGSALRSAVAEACRSLAARAGREPVAVVLVNDLPSVVLLLASILGGRRLVSLPLPGRGDDLADYADFVGREARGSGAALLCVPAGFEAFAIDGIDVVSTEEAVAGGGPAPLRGSDFGLVQYTSGSTGRPRGVLLDDVALGTNVAAILDRLGVGPGDSAYSWLPLSHDMGLVGMCLAGLVAAGPRWAADGRLTLARPEDFVRRPDEWMRGLSESGASVTAAPDFGYRLAAAAVRRGTAPDLSAVRVMLSGAEAVRRDTCVDFLRAVEGSGLDPAAFCPSYGMAEAGLAVTLAPGTDPRSASGDVLGVGHPVGGIELRTVAGPDGLGVAQVRGPSVARRDAAGRALVDDDGWLTTNDLVVERPDGWFVLGRADEVVVVAGRKLLAGDIARAVEVQPIIRSGTCVVWEEGGDLVALVEPGVAMLEPRALVDVRDHVRRAVTACTGVGPGRVVVAERGGVPRTTSGKPRRREAMRRVADLDIDLVEEWSTS